MNRWNHVYFCRWYNWDCGCLPIQHMDLWPGVILYFSQHNFRFVTAILLHFNMHYFSLNWEMKPEIISVDVVKCWIFKEEHWQGLYGSHHAMLSILLHHFGPACLMSDFVKLHPHWQRRKKQQRKPEVKGQHALRILMIICLIQVSARAMWFYGNPDCIASKF